ncbi:MAG: type IV pilus modification PilV family protein [Acidobacteriota bacterium]
MNRDSSDSKPKTEGKAHRSEAGFTLLETTIAMVLLAIAGLGVAACFFYAAKNNSSARDRELSMAVAQQEMEQFRNASFSDAALTATAGVSSTITRAGRRYVVQTTITDTNVQNGTARTKTIQVRVTPWSGTERWARNITSVFGSVTIISQRTAPAVGPNRAL